jgi:hypothetical protein
MIMTMLWILCIAVWSFMLGIEIRQKKPNEVTVISNFILIILFYVNVLFRLMQ